MIVLHCFRANKNKLGLKTYKNDKILLSSIIKITKNSRKKLYTYLEENEISYIVLDSDNNYKIKRYSNKNYLRAKKEAYINEIIDFYIKCKKNIDF